MIWPFRRRRADPDGITRERWDAVFRSKRKARYLVERTSTYRSELRDNALAVDLLKRNIFAWVDDPDHWYRDFVCRFSLAFDGPEHRAGGVVFRKANEETYYYFLVSNRGYFRFDVVFNGNPIVLVDWTELPPAEPERPIEPPRAETGQSSVARTRVEATVIGNGSRFTFCVDDRWVAEVDDDTIESGATALAAQNYDEADRATILFERVSIDSRPLHVQGEHIRWREVVHPDPDARVRLARTLFSQRSFPAAVIQLRKAMTRKAPDADSLFLLAECQINMAMYRPALENVERVLKIEPDRAEAVHERANLLYLLGEYQELKDFLDPRVSDANSSTLWNLSGHAAYNLGAYDEAQHAYLRAVELDGSMPLYHVNAARSLERLSDAPGAVSHYLEAVRLFSRDGVYDDVERVLPAIEALEPENQELRYYRGVLWFQKENFPRAREYFERLAAEGYQDSGLDYMLGLILSREGERRRALALFESAAAREPEFALYWFRVAETRNLLGENAADAMERTLRIAPDDPWNLNLAGQIALEAGKGDDALRCFEQAAAKLPGELDVQGNYAEALFRLGRAQEALRVLEGHDDAQAHNIRGTFYARLGRQAEALAAYERAYNKDRDDPVILENYAAACIESDLINRAETLLGRLIELAPSASVYNRTANLARIEGDYVRAEAAYREAFDLLGLADPVEELSGDDRERLRNENEIRMQAEEIEANLAELYLQWRRHDRARKQAERLIGYSSAPRSRRVLERIRLAMEVKVVCAGCGRVWWAPREPDVPTRALLHGDPAPESPAGKCPRCGNVYCVACAQQYLEGDRFVCRDCREKLNLNDEVVRYLALKYAEVP